MRAYLLQEDGSGAEDTRSRDFFYFPLDFFRHGWHQRVGLAGTRVLLITLDKSKRKPWFQLRTEVESQWYGVSPDTLQRGLDELREAGLLHIHARKVRDNKARFGTTIVNEYALLGAFQTPGIDRAGPSAGDDLMSRPIRGATTAIALVLIAVATTLATISVAIGVIDWASQTFGSLAVYLAGAFLAGAAVTHGIHRAIADRRLPGADRARDRR